MTRYGLHRVDNYLQEELFDPTLLAMSRRESAPNPKTKARTPRESRSSSLINRDSPGRALTLDLPHAPAVRIVKSKRRKRHIAAYRQSGEIIISVPFRTTRAEISAMVPELVARVMEGEEKNRRSECELEVRAKSLLSTYLPEFTHAPAAISWRTMNERWGSCTTIDRTIRISERLRTAPEYVIDHVLFHELIHLEIPGHGEDFHALLNRDPNLARAEAYLEGYEAGDRGL
jgi:predicted metal-dependent hydrolase